MRYARLFVILSLAGVVYAQSSVSGWMPIRTGDKWIYRHESRDQVAANEFETHSWKTEETITGSWNTPNGILVGMHVRVVEGSPRADYNLTGDPAYFVRGACLYGYYGEAAWNSATHQPSPDFLKGLNVGWLAPDFCFPLVIGKTWGSPHGLPDWHVTRPELAKDWQVAGVVAHDPSAPDRQETFHVRNISSYPGSGMTVDIWLEKGVGVVREEEIHHGTVGEERTRLLRYDPVR